MDPCQRCCAFCIAVVALFEAGEWRSVSLGGWSVKFDVSLWQAPEERAATGGNRCGGRGVSSGQANRLAPYRTPTGRRGWFAQAVGGMYGVSSVIREVRRRLVCTGLVRQGEIDEAMVSDEGARLGGFRSG